MLCISAKLLKKFLAFSKAIGGRLEQKSKNGFVLANLFSPLAVPEKSFLPLNICPIPPTFGILLILARLSKNRLALLKATPSYPAQKSKNFLAPASWFNPSAVPAKSVPPVNILSMSLAVSLSRPSAKEDKNSPIPCSPSDGVFIVAILSINVDIF